MIKFSELKTIKGYHADEIISALQKEIRRGNFEEAVFFGLELLESGELFEKKFWERIIVITVEDVSDSDIIPIVKTLKDNYYDLKNSKIGDREMQAIKAIKVLSDAKKDRIIGEIHSYYKIKRQEESFKLNIPDYALDMHTKHGKEIGRGKMHFIQESSKVNNQIKNKNKKYSDFLKKHQIDLN